MKDYLNPYVLANNARMRRASFKGAFLYVEGTSDEKLYGMFVNGDYCQIIIAHTKPNVIGACRILEIAGFQGAIGIIDADFDRIENKTINLDTVFSTDLHDGECLMLRSPAFDRLLFQFASPEKFQAWRNAYKSEIRDYLLQMAAFIGCLVWHSNHATLNLTFEGLEVGKFTDPESLEVNLQQLVRHIKNKSLRPDLTDAELIAGLQAKCPAPTEFWQVVRGHDFIDILSFAFRRAIATWSAQDVSRERLEQSLRLAYSKEYFITTQLYSQIRAWAAINPHFIVFF